MKNYLVIGGSSGIGQALSQILNDGGNSVYATYNIHEKTNEEGINYIYLDVMDDFDLNFLPDEIHGLAYCPGSINLKPFHRIAPEDFTEDFNLQVVGAIKTVQAVLSKLKQAKNASVVLFSTVAVQQGFTFHSQVSASKGAIEGLTRALAAEFAPTIRVNAIAPSLTNTPLASKLLSNQDKIEEHGKRHPLKRVGNASDIAEMAAFLLSDSSTWMTGQVIPVDGGMSSIKG